MEASESVLFPFFCRTAQFANTVTHLSMVRFSQPENTTSTLDDVRVQTLRPAGLTVKQDCGDSQDQKPLDGISLRPVPCPRDGRLDE